MGLELIKVCHLTSAHKSFDVRIFLKECSSLKRSGFDVSLVVCSGPSEVRNEIKIISIDEENKGRLNRMFHSSRKIYNKALSLNSDIYHIHDPELLPFALKLKRKGKCVVYDVHEDVPKQVMGKYWINPFLRKIVSYGFKLYENYVSKRMNLVVAATPSIRERFELINKNTIDVCNYPILNEVPALVNWENRQFDVCYIGSISKIRGIFEIINALEETPFTLHLAGDYSPPSLREELMNLPGWSKVKEYGFVDRTMIVQITSQCKTGLVTLYPQINYLDSLPVKMFEYMLSGTPVIASNFPLWKSIVEDNKCGKCIDPKDPKAIADAIKRIVSNPEAAETMGKNGRAAVLEKFNWSKEEEKLILAYKKLAENL